MFRAGHDGRGQLERRRSSTRWNGPRSAEAVPQAVAEIFADASRDRMLAARKTLALLEANRDNARPLMAAGRRLVFSKGTDSHDYKFSSAALEDFYHISPAWRNRFLASTMFHLKGSAGNEYRTVPPYPGGADC